ncbi:MAG: TonB-dependent receptor plug domain-containing protein, partial [Cyclobacteriaceae bacterium]
MRKVLLLLIMVGISFSASFAQQRNVTGTVISEDDNEGIPGVNVVLKGTSIGAITDIEGNYSISVPGNNAVLVFSFVGLKAKEVNVGARSVIDISMEADVSQLEEVVVTAFGVEREKKALGYSVQEVSGKSLDNSGADNVLDALNGKAAGVNIISSSGTVGAASNVTIRGNTSLVGSNQALIVVDGVRLNNDANYTEGTTSGTAQASGLNSINPADIESVTVLKGAAATALYGTAGATGVLVITTKKGKKGSGLRVNFNSQVGFDIVSTLPDLQTTFAQGSQGNIQYPESGASGSWGPRLSDLRYDGDENYAYDRN